MIKRNSALALLVVIFLSITSLSFASPSSTPSNRVGLANDLIYFVMPDRYNSIPRTPLFITAEISKV